MKTTLVTLIFLLISLIVYPQTNFEKAVKSALVDMDSAKTNEDFKAVAAKFERIAAVETGEWLPPYYSGLVYCIMAFRTENTSEKQIFVDYAQKQVDLAMKIAPEESEVYTLQGMIYQAVIGIDPMGNGQLYSGKAAGAFTTASELNPANPRPYYLQAISVMYTPEEYGGGKKAACNLFVKANELFASFMPSSDIAPHWGKEDCSGYLATCRE
jgi:hypothetical protein